jgi:hypothetical protein
MGSFHYLTKSRYMLGLQCPKLLWLSINKPEEGAETDEATQHRFDVGHRIGEYARLRFDGGVLIAEDHMHLSDAVRSTKAAVENGAPSIFEATEKYDTVLCRADILERVSRKGNTWDIVEVKMSGDVKDPHYDDLAIQRYCFEKAGYSIRNTRLMHIDTKYVRKGEIDPGQLLAEKDITEEVLARQADIGGLVKEFSEILCSKKCPVVDPNDQCESPYPCPYFELCNKPVVEGSIYFLPRGKKIWPMLEEMKIKKIKDIPDDFKLNRRQRQMVISARTGEPVVDKDEIKALLDSLEYPLYFFDFETISPAIPAFDKSRPYQNLPFQFSLDIQKKKNGPCKHHEFLLKEQCDPREALAKEMVKLLGKKGSIIAYNISFEQTRIKDLAETFPKLSKELFALLPRFWDLLVPFRSGHYIHHDFLESVSIKNVLPVLVPSLSYKSLPIQEGGTASLKYELWATGEMKKAEWENIYKDLLKYCGLDTLAMVEILRVLYARTK